MVFSTIICQKKHWGGIEPKTPETKVAHLSDLKRLIGEWNREIVQKSAKAGLNLSGKKTNIDEVIPFVLDEGKRKEEETKNENAMKATMFLEWAEQRGKQLSKEEIQQKIAA